MVSVVGTWLLPFVTRGGFYVRAIHEVFVSRCSDSQSSSSRSRRCIESFVSLAVIEDSASVPRYKRDATVVVALTATVEDNNCITEFI
jgi:hypothetical protein